MARKQLPKSVVPGLVCEMLAFLISCADASMGVKNDHSRETKIIDHISTS